MCFLTLEKFNILIVVLPDSWIWIYRSVEVWPWLSWCTNPLVWLDVLIQWSVIYYHRCRVKTLIHIVLKVHFYYEIPIVHTVCVRADDEDLNSLLGNKSAVWEYFWFLRTDRSIPHMACTQAMLLLGKIIRKHDELGQASRSANLLLSLWLH